MIKKKPLTMLVQNNAEEKEEKNQTNYTWIQNKKKKVGSIE